MEPVPVTPTPAPVTPTPAPTPSPTVKAIDWAKLIALVGVLLGQFLVVLKPEPAPTPAPGPNPPAPVVVEADPELVIVELPDGTRTTDPALETAGAKLNHNGTWIVRGVPKPGEKGWVRTITVTDGADPPKPPKPPEPVPPTPPVPIPATGFRVLMVYESGDNLTREQLNIINSTAIRSYLNEKCVKVDGRAEWRAWDDDVDVSKETELWRKIWATAKPQITTLPALAVINDTAIQWLPLPATEAETLATLKRYGG